MRVVPVFLVTKEEALETREEPMVRVKSVRAEQYWKQYEKLVTAVFLSNSPDGMDAREEQP